MGTNFLLNSESWWPSTRQIISQLQNAQGFVFPPAEQYRIAWQGLVSALYLLKVVLQLLPFHFLVPQLRHCHGDRHHLEMSLIAALKHLRGLDRSSQHNAHFTLLTNHLYRETFVSSQCNALDVFPISFLQVHSEFLLLLLRILRWIC